MIKNHVHVNVLEHLTKRKKEGRGATTNFRENVSHESFCCK